MALPSLTTRWHCSKCRVSEPWKGIWAHNSMTVSNLTIPAGNYFQLGRQGARGNRKHLKCCFFFSCKAHNTKREHHKNHLPPLDSAGFTNLICHKGLVQGNLAAVTWTQLMVTFAFHWFSPWHCPTGSKSTAGVWWIANCTGTFPQHPQRLAPLSECLVVLIGFYPDTHACCLSVSYHPRLELFWTLMTIIRSLV